FDLNAVDFPHQRRCAIGYFGTIEADDPALLVAVWVFVTMADVNEVPLNHRRAIDRSATKEIAPHFLAGAHLESVYAAISSTAHNQALPSDHPHHWGRIVGVLDLPARAGPPNGFSCPFVERDEAIAATCLVSPVRVDDARNHQVAVNGGTCN